MREQLDGKTILFVVADDFTYRIRQYKEALSLTKAGARVVFLCMGVGKSEIWENAPFEIISLPKYQGKPHFSKLRIRPFRIILNLTWHRSLRFFDKCKKKRDLPKFIDKGISLRPDLVHAVDLGALEISAKIASSAGAKLVYDSCDYWLGFLSNPLWDSSRDLANKLALDEKRYIHDASLVLVTGKTMQKQLSKDYDLNTCRIIYNSIDVERNNTDKKCLDDQIRLVYHGAILPDRNVDKLIRIFAETPKNAILDIYGEFISCNREDFEKLIIELNLQDRVHLYGKFSYEDMLVFLPRYDIGIYLAQRTDNNFDITVPTKLFDCICAGLAVFMPNFSSIEEELKGIHCGITVDTDDEDVTKKELLKLLEDRTLIEQYKHASADVASKYNWSAQGDYLVSLYQELTCQ